MEQAYGRQAVVKAAAGTLRSGAQPLFYSSYPHAIPEISKLASQMRKAGGAREEGKG
jgi:hypothetical protein